MKKLNSSWHFDCLLSKWCFYTLAEFIEHVESSGFTEYDGYGSFVYLDKDFNLYEEDADVISICRQYSFSTIEELQEKMSTDDYKLFAVLWFNK